MEPINIAAPQWTCPHCERNYYADYDAAKCCVDLGPAPVVDSEPLILDLRHRSQDEGTFGVAEPGPVRLNHERTAHIQDFVLGDKTIASSLLDENVSDDHVHILTSGREVIEEKHHPTGGAHWKAFNAMFALQDSFGEVKELYWPGSFAGRYTAPWFGPLSPELREVIETLAPRSAGRFSNMTVTELREEWDTYVSRRGREFRARDITSGVSFIPSGKVLTSIALSHGFGPLDGDGQVRWVNVHWDMILDWLAERWVGWWNGADVAVPGIQISSENLPKNPGKKRMSVFATVLADLDVDGKGNERVYYDVAHATTDSLTLEDISGIVCPVDGAPDAATFYKNSQTAKKDR